MFKHDYKNYIGYKWPESDLSIMRSKKLATYRTYSLFRETTKPCHNKIPLYCLTEEEKGDLPSAYQIYMNSIDEYDAALKLVGTLTHWKRLCGCDWFMYGKGVPFFPGLQSWREDKKLKNASEAWNVLMNQAKRGNVSASQSVVNKLGIKNVVGRPTKKEDLSEEKEKQAKIVQLVKGISK